MKFSIRLGLLALICTALMFSCDKDEIQIDEETTVQANGRRVAFNAPSLNQIATPLGGGVGGGPDFSVSIESGWQGLQAGPAYDLRNAGEICLSIGCEGSPQILECWEIDEGSTLSVNESTDPVNFRLTNMSWDYTGGQIAGSGYWQCVGDNFYVTINDACGCVLGSVAVPGPSATGPWSANNTVNISVLDVLNYATGGSCNTNC